MQNKFWIFCNFIHLREGLGPAVGLHAPVVADSVLPVVETFEDGIRFALVSTHYIKNMFFYSSPQLRFGSTPLQPRMPPLSDLMMILVIAMKKRRSEISKIFGDRVVTLSSSTIDRVPSCRHIRPGLLREWSTWPDENQRLNGQARFKVAKIKTRIKYAQDNLIY